MELYSLILVTFLNNGAMVVENIQHDMTKAECEQRLSEGVDSGEFGLTDDSHAMYVRCVTDVHMF